MTDAKYDKRLLGNRRWPWSRPISPGRALSPHRLCRWQALVPLALVFWPPSMEAQPPGVLPSWVDDAIAFGQKNRVHSYALVRPGPFVDELVGSITTPFVRVAIAASEAHAKLLPFTRDSVTAAMLEPVLRVSAWPILGRQVTDHHREVEHLVIAPRRSDRPEEAIQPITIEPFTETIFNNLGARTERQGKIAAFPLSALRVGLVILIVYDDKRVEVPIDQDMIEAVSP